MRFMFQPAVRSRRCCIITSILIPFYRRVCTKAMQTLCNQDANPSLDFACKSVDDIIDKVLGGFIRTCANQAKSYQI